MSEYFAFVFFMFISIYGRINCSDSALEFGLGQNIENIDEEINTYQKPPPSRNGHECTYFSGFRNSSAEGSLANCSWYKADTCCKRTEVTSVFMSMPPLYEATKTCRNMMNYLMCFFCSPYQKDWYQDGRAVICAAFCQDVYENCKDASNDGIKIKDRYSNGKDFCRAQNFDIMQGENDCFAYDPTVFGDSSTISVSFHLLLLINMIYFLCRF